MEFSKLNIGFSTGSVALGNFREGVNMLRRKNIEAIELSALREDELEALLNAIDYNLELSSFKYISFHAPSKLIYLSEENLIFLLQRIVNKHWFIIVHPDIISRFDLWRSLGSNLCIENMDKRKNVGRTTSDMEVIFKKLPDASFCLDLAHAKQVDPTMLEAVLMLNTFSSRLVQIHLSTVNSQSKHESLNLESILSFSKLAALIPNSIPIILESPVNEDKIDTEVLAASLIFDTRKLMNLVEPLMKSSQYFYSIYNSLGKSLVTQESLR